MRRLVLPVVVPCFNVEKEIASVIRELPSWVASIIAVDDGSTDSTATVLGQLAAEDSRLTVISRDRNGGVGAAMVPGYRAALQSGAEVPDQRQLFLPVAEDGIGRFMGDGGSV